MIQMTRRIAAALALAVLLLAVVALLVTVQKHRDRIARGASMTVVAAEADAPGHTRSR